ncbi:MAG: hypothetical protein H0X53_05795, partial [Sphingomonas sp.]|nr:hypothetical protein [Sphingomonas sp.]
MARTRFAKAVGQTSFGTPERASVREALWFDIEAAETSGDDSLSESRVASLDPAGLLLGTTHLLIGITCLVSFPELARMAAISNPLIPLAMILLLDCVAAAGLQWRKRLELAPHTVSRAMCGYLA